MIDYNQPLPSSEMCRIDATYNYKPDIDNRQKRWDEPFLSCA